MSTSTATRRHSCLVPQNEIFCLHGSWAVYEQLRRDPQNNGIRMYYSDGDLLLMTVGYTHERIRSMLGLMILEWLDQRDIPAINAGQWTLRLSTQDRGLESDNCYYIRSLDLVEGKDDLDLTVDPPPDLAIEVDITTHSELKFAIYASLQVPELWVWQESAVRVYRLQGTEYVIQPDSVELADFPLSTAAEVILEQHAGNDLAVKRTFRAAISQ